MKRRNILKINDEELVTVSRMFGYPGTIPVLPPISSHNPPTL